MHPLPRYLLDRLDEASTWRGLVALATAAGLTLSPDQSEKIIAAGLALIGLLGTLLPDRRRP